MRELLGNAQLYARRRATRKTIDRESWAVGGLIKFHFEVDSMEKW